MLHFHVRVEIRLALPILVEYEDVGIHGIDVKVVVYAAIFSPGRLDLIDEKAERELSRYRAVIELCPRLSEIRQPRPSRLSNALCADTVNVSGQGGSVVMRGDEDFGAPRSSR